MCGECEGGVCEIQLHVGSVRGVCEGQCKVWSECEGSVKCRSVCGECKLHVWGV